MSSEDWTILYREQPWEQQQRGEQRAGDERLQAGQEQVPPALHPARGREAGLLLQLHPLAGTDAGPRSAAISFHYDFGAYRRLL